MHLHLLQRRSARKSASRRMFPGRAISTYNCSGQTNKRQFYVGKAAGLSTFVTAVVLKDFAIVRLIQT